MAIAIVRSRCVYGENLALQPSLRMFVQMAYACAPAWCSVFGEGYLIERNAILNSEPIGSMIFWITKKQKTKTNVSYLFFVNCNKRTSNLLFLIRCLTGVLCIPSGVYFAFCCFIEKQNKKWSYTQHTYKHFK